MSQQCDAHNSHSQSKKKRISAKIIEQTSKLYTLGACGDTNMSITFCVDKYCTRNEIANLLRTCMHRCFIGDWEFEPASIFILEDTDNNLETSDVKVKIDENSALQIVFTNNCDEKHCAKFALWNRWLAQAELDVQQNCFYPPEDTSTFWISCLPVISELTVQSLDQKNKTFILKGAPTCPRGFLLLLDHIVTHLQLNVIKRNAFPSSRMLKVLTAKSKHANLQWPD